MEKGIGRQLSHDVLEKYRFRSIELRKKGWKVNDIADAFGVNRRAVTRWSWQYQKGGRKELRSRKAPGPKQKLTKIEMKNLLNLLRKDALNYGFETPLWTCKRIQQLIATKIGKKLNNVTIWRLLILLGLSNQTPERRALQENPRKAKRWLKEIWPIIQEHRRRWQAIIYFQDESGVSLIPVVGKTWALKGHPPKICVTNARGGFCLSSAISSAGRLVFRVEKGRVNAKTFIGFLIQIISHHPNRKIIIITDQARPHIAKLVKEFTLSNEKHLAVYYLPPHSPHLNPDEKVWNHLKNKKLKAHQARTKKELKPILVSKMRSIQKDKPLLHSFFVFYNGL